MLESIHQSLFKSMLTIFFLLAVFLLISINHKLCLK